MAEINMNSPVVQERIEEIKQLQEANEYLFSQLTENYENLMKDQESFVNNCAWNYHYAEQLMTVASKIMIVSERMKNTFESLSEIK